MSHFNRATIIIHRTQRVASRTERYDLSPFADQTLEVAPINLARFGIHLRNVQVYAALNYQRLPGCNISVVLEFGDHDFVSRTKLTTERARQMIDHRRGIRAEHNFISGSI